MKVIICGSRDFNDYKYMEKCIERSGFNITEIVSGAAKGADSLGERYAKEHDIKLTRFPADWNSLGKKAGPIRNQQMIDYVYPDGGLIAFPINESIGTRDSIRRAENKGLHVRVYEKS